MRKWVSGLAVSGLAVMLMLIMAGCHKPSQIEQYRAEKHVRDSVGLADQQRSLDYYQQQLDSLLPQADSLLRYFTYEKNERYQDHGNYVITVTGYGLRVMVRDDGQEILLYRDGKRLTNEQVNGLKSEREREAYERAQHLQIVIHDIKELEKRIDKTSLEIQKYQKRLGN